MLRGRTLDVDMDVDEWLIVPSLCKQSMRVNPVRERGTPTRAEVGMAPIRSRRPREQQEKHNIITNLFCNEPHTQQGTDVIVWPTKNEPGHTSLCFVSAGHAKWFLKCCPLATTSCASCFTFFVCHHLSVVCLMSNVRTSSPCGPFVAGIGSPGSLSSSCSRHSHPQQQQQMLFKAMNKNIDDECLLVGRDADWFRSAG